MSAIDTPGADGWKTAITEMFDGAREAALRFPVTALFLFALAFQTHMEIAGVRWFRDFDWYLQLGLASGALASLAVTLGMEARGYAVPILRHFISFIAAMVVSVAVFLADATRLYEYPILPALGGLVLVLPYMVAGSPGAFWLFAVRFAFAVVLAGLVLLLGAGGISAIMASLTYLFGIGIDNDLYAHVWSLTGLFLAPLFGLGRLPAHFDEQPAKDGHQYMDTGIRVLGDYVAAPLLIVYAFILHIYAGKIFITGDVPKGQIGWLVLAYGFCVFGSLIVTYPYWRAARVPMRLLLRIWPFVMPVPLLLLAHAAWLRIGQYGLTPERYLLVMFGLCTAIVVVVQFPKALRGDIRVLAAVPVFALLVASFGPQGAVGLSLRSQTARFLEIVNSGEIDTFAKADAVSALRLISRYGGLAAVAPEGIELSGKGRPLYDSGQDFRNVAEAWGLDPDSFNSGNSSVAFFKYFNATAAIRTAGYDTLLPAVSLYDNPNMKHSVKLGSGSIVFSLKKAGINADWRDRTHMFAIGEKVISELAAAGNAPQMIELRSGERVIGLVLQQVNGEREPAPHFVSFTATILLRSQDWK